MKVRAFLALSFLAILPAITSTGIAQDSGAATSSKPSLAPSFGSVPLSFEVNQGQSGPSVRFLSHGNGYSLFLTDSSAVFVLSKPGHISNPKSGTKLVAGDVVRMELAGTRPNIRISGTEQLPGKANYFIGNDPSKWHSDVPTYAKVRYESVYPGVDLLYYGNQRQLEYDFIVAPHADAKPMRLHFAGAQHLNLTPNGDLTIKGKNGEIVFHKPVVYQLKDGLREPVPGRFQLLARNTVRFTLGSYDHTRELVIDPALAYSTYLGGSGADVGNAIAVGAAGDAYVVGNTASVDFPVTSGTFQQANESTPLGTVGFITKFSQRGSALIYSTYLGGTSGGDSIAGLAIDAAENVYVTGSATSVDFPVTSNAFQKVNHYIPAIAPSGNILPTNAFVTKLNSTGSALFYSTYLGGSGNYHSADGGNYGDFAAGIAIDFTGNAYVVGTAMSLDFPVTPNAFQKVNNAANNTGFNLFVAKLNPAGSDLVYSTYLGGSALGGNLLIHPNAISDTAAGIVINSAGDAYVTGTAYSRNYPVTTNAYQRNNRTIYDPVFQSGGSNAVITELNPTGSALIYSTYLGGTRLDRASSIAINSAGNVYVAGTAESTDFPITSNAFQQGHTIGAGFVTELNPTGSALVYSTYLGGGPAGSGAADSVSAIALDTFGSAYVTGIAHTFDFPVTGNAFRKVNHGTSGNAFFSKLDTTGSALLYSSYLGGATVRGLVSGDFGSGIAVDALGNAYLTGQACSTDFPLAGTPFQTAKKGTGCTAFVSKFIVNTVTGTTLTSDGNPQKAGTAVTFTAHVAPNTGTTIPIGSVTFSINRTPQTTVALDDTGHAAWTISTLDAGRYDITAAYSGSPTDSGSSASLGEIIIGAPARIAVASGANQTAVEGTPFALPLIVQVQDAYGVPVPGAVVTFSGSGLMFSGNPAVTNAEGRASVVATATTTGTLTVTASTAGVSTPATFRLTATPAP